MNAIAILLSAAAAASSAPANPQASPPNPLTAQQQFDAASAAQLEGRCDVAIKGFETLEARPGTAKNVKVLATIRLRKSLCLGVIGRIEEAVQNIGLALPLLSPDNPIERDDIVRARLALGRIALLEFDYARAKQEFSLAKSLLPAEKQIESLVWLSRVTMFDPGLESIQYAEEALKIAGSLAGSSKTVLADLHTLHARALLNHGRKGEAFAELKKALASQGGLTLRVSLADVVTRSDLALAAMMNGDPEAARQYLAYTGAGRFEKSPFARAAQMEPPACGGPANLAPDDVAVVEFSIKDDGAVGYATPIFVSRNGPAGVEFARAVHGWSWKVADVAAIPLLFRQVTRVELRCSTSAERPDVTEMLGEDLVTWLADNKFELFPANDNETMRFNAAKAEIGRRTASGGGVALVPPLLALGVSPLATEDERQNWLVQARDILVQVRAPVTVRSFFEVQIAYNSASGWGDGSRRREMLRTVLSQSDIAADPHASGTLRLLIADSGYHSPAPVDATSLVLTTANDPRLPAGDPLKTAALVRLATLQAKAGDIVAARESYEKTGLSAQQCALVDARPSLKRSGASSSDFPMEAMHWGFEGWVSVEFDILPDGKTSGLRAVVAYPPLVFRDAAVGILKDSRYEQTYRPDGGPGCGGARQAINFQIPH